jgi:iturin family lipopeptide synthetase B
MMGGDSLNSIQIASRLNKAGYKIEMRHLFHYPTIAELALFVKRTDRIADQGVVSGVVPLTPVQYRFFARNIAKPHHYNQAAMLHARGTFDADTVRAVFSRLLLHHDALRMTFARDEDGNISAFNQGGEQSLALQVFDFCSTLNEPRETVDPGTVEARANELQASLDLEKGPLMKLALFHLDEGDHLLIAIHHLVVDGVSWRILFEDIDQLFKQYRDHRDPARLELPLKSDSLKAWSEKLSVYANRTSEDFIREKIYWRELGESQAPEFARDYPDGDNYVEHIDTLSFQLSESDTQSLLTTVNEAFNTEINDLLLTALTGAFGETFGIRRLLVALEGHGREEILEDVDVTRTVGWFISVYPVLLNIASGEDLSRRIVDVKETLRRVPNNGIGYGILKYLTVPELKEGINLNIEPRVRFNYSGQFDVDVEKETFEITERMTGRRRDANEPREYELEVEGRVIDRRMTMTITFGAKQYKRETIEILTQRFQAGLEQIVSHCLGVDKQEVTPSDLGYKDISVDQLKNFFD